MLPAGLALRKRQTGLVPPEMEDTSYSLLRRDLETGGGGVMVTYSDLFTYSLVIIGIIGLCMQFRQKKK